LRRRSPDPLEVQKIEIDDQPFKNDGLLANSELVNIEITEAGLTGTIGASITVPSPEEEGVEATRTPAPAPMLPLPGAKDLFFAASDDIFNLLFAAATLQGNFRTDCVEVLDGVGEPLTVEDTLPADCDALEVPGKPLQTATLIGRCHGAKEDIACAALPFGQQFGCNNTQTRLADRNISKDTPLLFCGRQLIAPRTLIKDNLLTMNEIEASLHVNDLKITVALDRNDSGTLDEAFSATRNCFSLLPDNTVDCKFVAACFDLNLDAGFELGAGPNGDPQIIRNVRNVAESVGFACGGAFNLGDDNLLTKSGASDPVSLISENIQNIVRLFEAEGLTLGGLVNFTDPMLFAIDTDNSGDCSDCAEYVGVTGKVVAAPPP